VKLFGHLSRATTSEAVHQRKILNKYSTQGSTDHRSSQISDHVFSQLREAPYCACEQQRLATDQTTLSRGTIMKTLISALLALTVLTGVAASASAFDSKTFYQEQDRSHN
jgi:hypothetical protein